MISSAASQWKLTMLLDVSMTNTTYSLSTGMPPTAPVDGTSLINAYAAIRTLSPLPDQVVLVTDGLPTQGAQKPGRKFVNVGQRSRFFDEAERSLPQGVPVSVILLPMQGDLPAPHMFWTLARATGGNFLMPARDWP